MLEVPSTSSDGSAWPLKFRSPSFFAFSLHSYQWKVNQSSLRRYSRRPQILISPPSPPDTLVLLVFRFRVLDADAGASFDEPKSMEPPSTCQSLLLKSIVPSAKIVAPSSQQPVLPQ